MRKTAASDEAERVVLVSVDVLGGDGYGGVDFDGVVVF